MSDLIPDNVNFCAWVRDALRLHKQRQPMPQQIGSPGRSEPGRPEAERSSLIKLAHSALNLHVASVAKGVPIRDADERSKPLALAVTALREAKR
jgi:hypothetical protein